MCTGYMLFGTCVQATCSFPIYHLLNLMNTKVVQMSPLRKASHDPYAQVAAPSLGPSSILWNPCPPLVLPLNCQLPEDAEYVIFLSVPPVPSQRICPSVTWRRWVWERSRLEIQTWRLTAKTAGGKYQWKQAHKMRTLLWKEWRGP